MTPTSAMVEKSAATKRQLFITIGIESALAKAAKRTFSKDEGQYYIAGSELGFNRNYYVNVVDDYCIEGFLHKNFADRLDQFYSDHAALSPEAIESINALILKKGKFKLIISRNKKRAEKIKKVLGKYFYTKNQ